MSVTDDLLRNNEAYAEKFDKGDIPLPPAKHVAVVACMDARLDVHGLLGLELGDAHVIRNAGGVVTDDEIRSLAISQRLLGTKEIVLIHHTDCGMLTFTDLDADVRSSIGRIKASPFIPNKSSVRGFVYDVHTGRLREVTPA
jgi:carbonic anhydrase